MTSTRVKSIDAADKVGTPVRVGAPAHARDRTHGGSPIVREGFQPVLSIRACVEPTAVPAFIHDALLEIRMHIEDRQLEVRGEPFSIFHSASPDGVDVEAGWPVDDAVGTDRVAAGALPVTAIRSTRHTTAAGSADAIG